ncbi:MAG: BadF/BadG/BcrA/BcrD ATPase family protein, partial [Psychrilyobacter sp.]|uniref:BadF/BadG/BcrA/BcrD ATPase family protein n=1 Tax=Psychrilyobacter sp. TaxID=2586924 RepID=UPI003C78102A
SLACQPGVNIVCGTGSIAIGVNEKNEIARSGGWGEFVGDEASAYWIAKKAIKVFSKQSDFRLERTILYRIFKEDLNLAYDFELIDLLQNKYKLSRSKVAKISMIVSKIASLGDESAIEIFKEAAHEIYLMIHSIIKQLDFKKNVTVSYTGGVFKSENLILTPLRTELEINKITVEIIKPILSPTIGSALFAYKLDGNKITKEVIENLKK